MKIPVFALVEQSVHNEYKLYQANKENAEIDPTKVRYPSVDDQRIFRFIEEVQGATTNNALVPFGDYSDIESYLKQQWAGMFYNFLTRDAEKGRVGDVLAEIAGINQRVAFIGEQLLKTQGTAAAQAMVAMYDEMLASHCVRDLGMWRLKPKPLDILQNDTFLECAKALGVEPRVDSEDQHYSISSMGDISKAQLKTDEKDYSALRKKLQQILDSYQITLEDLTR